MRYRTEFAAPSLRALQQKNIGLISIWFEHLWRVFSGLFSLSRLLHSRLALVLGYPLFFSLSGPISFFFFFITNVLNIQSTATSASDTSAFSLPISISISDVTISEFII
jgi:hypothetical protein